MKKLFLALSLASILGASEFVLDKVHTSVEFSVKHMLVSNAKGKFKSFDAMIDFDEANKTFKVFNASVDVASVDTNSAKRDEHIQAGDFLNAKVNPQLTFVMSKYEKISDSQGKMIGELTINGVKKEVAFDVTINGVANIGDKTKLGFDLNLDLLRKDFDVAKDTNEGLVANEVKVQIFAEADKK